MCSIFWLLSAKKLISPRNRVPSGFLDFLETFLYSKFVQEETFFWLVHQYRMLNYRFKAGLTKWPSNQVEKDQVTYLYSIFFLKETFAFQILVLLQYNRALLSGDSPKIFWVSFGFHVGFIWFSFGFHLGFIWISYGILMGFVWVSFGFHLGFISVSFGLHLDFIWVSFGCHLSYIGVSFGFYLGFIYISIEFNLKLVRFFTLERNFWNVVLPQSDNWLPK